MQAAPATATSGSVPARGAIVSAPFDLLTGGGLSLVAMALYVGSGAPGSDSDVFARLGFLSVLINAPHFMASFATLYSAREVARRHRAIALGLPLLLMAWVITGVLAWQRWLQPLNLLTAAASLLLAWHYTGQTFGVMATHTVLDGTPLAPDERRLLRVNLGALLAWHALWAIGILVHSGSADPQATLAATQVVRGTAPLALSTAVLGAVALARFARRTGVRPSARMVLPWLAIHGWYALMALDPRALFIAQISHALQYLPFPTRVQLNRTSSSSMSGAIRAAIFFGVLVVAGQLAFHGLPDLAARAAASLGWALPMLTSAVGHALNVHHYFVDAAVWKVGDPQVRKELLGHLS